MGTPNSMLTIRVSRRQFLKVGLPDTMIDWRMLSNEEWIFVLREELASIKPHLRYLTKPSTVQELISTASKYLTDHDIYPRADRSLRVINEWPVHSLLVPSQDISVGGWVYLCEDATLVATGSTVQSGPIRIFVLDDEAIMSTMERARSQKVKDFALVQVTFLVDQLKKRLEKPAEARLERAQGTRRAVEELGSVLGRISNQ